jgi:hypothetical protein
MGRSLLRRVTFVAVGALFGIALDIAATAAAGHDQESFGLGFALGLLAGFPLSLVAFVSTVYAVGLAPPLLWMAIAWTVARRREGVGSEWAAPVLLLMQVIGGALTPLAFGAARTRLFHWSSQTWGGLALFVVLWLIGLAEAVRLLHRPSSASEVAEAARSTRRAVRVRLAVAVVLILVAAGVLLARPRLEIVCAARDLSCTVTERTWRGETRTWPFEQIRIRPGVPYSTLEVGPASAPRTILRVHCADVIVGGNFFNSCESRHGRLLADLELFLQRRTPERIALRHDDLEGARLIAAALICSAAWIVLGALRPGAR